MPILPMSMSRVHWNMIYNWGCNSPTPGATILYLNNNGTMTTSTGYSGTWSVTGNQITITINATTYTGTVTGTHMGGYMGDTMGNTGCWTADKQ